MTPTSCVIDQCPATHVVEAHNTIGESYTGAACLPHVAAVINRARMHFAGDCDEDAAQVTVTTMRRKSLWEAG